MTGPAYRQIPSIEKFLVYVLKAELGVRVVTELPHNFQDVNGPTDGLPVIHVDRIAGADLDWKADRPIVDIDCYGPDRETASDLGHAVHAYLRFVLPGQRVAFEGAGVVVTRTRTVVGPRFLPHANPAVRRCQANYELILHSSP